MQKKYSKEAVLKVLKYLYETEPKCGDCEECKYGWTGKEEDKIACKKLKESKRKDWEIWAKKVNKWLERRYNCE